MAFIKMDLNLLQDKRLSLNEKIIYSFLDNECNLNKDYRRGLDYLANSIGVSQATVKRATKSLLLKGFINISYSSSNLGIITVNPWKARKKMDTELLKLFDKVYRSINHE